MNSDRMATNAENSGVLGWNSGGKEEKKEEEGKKERGRFPFQANVT